MANITEAQTILSIIGMPPAQQNERSALTLLSLAHLTMADRWTKTQRPLVRIVDIMAWMREHHGKDYAPNSRETIRRQTIHQFEAARLIDRNPDDPSRPTNSGDTNYQLTETAAEMLASYGSKLFEKASRNFVSVYGSLVSSYRRDRDLQKVPVTLPDGTSLKLSPGGHNVLQALIVEEFAPRFAKGAVLLYLGDTANKRLHISTEILKNLNIPEMNHDKLPDVVLYDEEKNWLFLIEAVTSHGPVSPKRYAELELALEECPSERVYVTAFLDSNDFRRNAGDIAWESEVWLADSPDHMIHYDGEQFLGPYPVH